MQFLSSTPAGLETLCDSESGRDWLAERLIFSDTQPFLAALSPPTQTTPVLASLRTVGAAIDPHLIFSGHQISCDYRWSVVTKINTLLEVEQCSAGAVLPVLVWLDTDRCGSDKLSTSFGWPARAGEAGINLVSNSQRRGESRFVNPRADMLEAAARQLEAALPGAPRIARLAELLRAHDGRSLGELNLALTHLLFDAQQISRKPRYLVSDLNRDGAMSLGLERIIEHRDKFVRVFNEALVGLGVDGVECPLPERAEDYLPLHWNCPNDLRRNALHAVQRGGDRYASARCKCGESFEVRLGAGSSGPPAPGAVEALGSERISPDVCAPLLFGSCFSGSVGGRSSALYGIVLNEVATRALDLAPLPVLIAQGIHSPPPTFAEVDSLLHAWLHAPSA